MPEKDFLGIKNLITFLSVCFRSNEITFLKTRILLIINSNVGKELFTGQSRGGVE